MHLITRYFVSGTLLTLSVTATAQPPTPEDQATTADRERPEEAPAPATGLRWIAQVEERSGVTALLVTDTVTGTRYRLSDFEGIGVVHAHWIGPNHLEVDLATQNRVLEVRGPDERGAPTFHLVTSRFDVEGAARVDYYSPPLVAQLDRRPPSAEREKP